MKSCELASRKGSEIMQRKNLNVSLCMSRKYYTESMMHSFFLRLELKDMRISFDAHVIHGGALVLGLVPTAFGLARLPTM
jgi:hypothetical protein